MSDHELEAGEADPIAGETKHDRFVRLAERRTQLVLEKLRILGNCSNRGIYEYSEDEIERIFRAILRQVDITRSQFEDRARRVEFKL